MTTTSDGEIPAIIGDFLLRSQDRVVAEWSGSPFFLAGGQDPEQVTRDCTEVFRTLRRAIEAGAHDDPAAEAFGDIRTLLGVLAAQHGQDGRIDSGTAIRISALRQPLLRLWQEEQPDAEAYAAGAVLITSAVDTLRLVLVDTALTSALDIVSSQREQLTELSTPVIKIWEGVLAIPLIGTLDSMRSQVATESLLQGILDQQARVAILDITGVSTVDTMVAQHLLKTVMAARLMGAECVISGIRPQIATTMVQLGIDLGEVVTKARLSEAFAYALSQVGHQVVAAEPGPGAG